MSVIDITQRITIEETAQLCERVIQEVEKAIVGKTSTLKLMMAAF